MQNTTISSTSKEQWAPYEGPQTMMLECNLPEVMIGGARGPGKTVALLWDFIAHEARYGKRAVGAIFRKKYNPDLQDVINKGHRLLEEQLGWTYHHTAHRWTAPSGATLSAYYCETLKDALNYKGHEWNWLGIDEAGDWPDPAPLDFLWGCLRSAEGIPSYRRMSCNPGGPGHMWVKERYDPAKPFIVKYWQPQEKERPDLKIPYVFIPGTLEDNPGLMKNDPTYEARLAASGSPELFKAWRYGDWDVVAGAFFDNFDPEKHVIEILPPGSTPGKGQLTLEPWHQRWISMDWGFQDNTVVLWHAVTEDRTVVTYKELVTNHTEPRALGELILANTGKTENIHLFYLGHDAFAARTSPRTIAQEVGETVKAGGIPLPVVADTDRIGGWSLMYQMLNRGSWKIGTRCPELIKSLPLLQRDERHVEDVAESPFDHAPDAARYGLKSHLRSVRVPLEEQIAQQMDGRMSEDIGLRAIQYRAIKASLRKKTTRGFRTKRRHRYAAA